MENAILVASVIIGFSLMVVLIGSGLDAIFTRFPRLLPIMRWAGAAYMLWLAWRIANSGPVRQGEAQGHPLGFFGAAQKCKHILLNPAHFESISFRIPFSGGDVF